MGNSKGFWRSAFDLDTGPTQPRRTDVRSDENVHDDSVWGTGWSDSRRAAAQRLSEKRVQDVANAKKNEEKLSTGRRLTEMRRAENPESVFKWARFEGNSKFHITPSGEARHCQASTRPCPYGSDDHFTMGNDSAVDPQKAAEWIMEHRHTGHDSTLSYRLDSVEAENPRAIARQAGEDSRRRKTHANIVTMDATIHLEDKLKPITLSRRIGNTYGNRLADHAYWVLDCDWDHNRLVTDRMTESQLQSFVDRYVETSNTYLPEYREEFKAELTAQIKQLMQVAEGEASQAQIESSHFSTVPLELEGLPGMNEEGQFAGTVNYAASGFEPRHLRVPLKNGGRVQEVTFAKGFEVFDNDAGEGTAGWRLVKETDGWDLTVIGSRGDEHLFRVTSPDEAEEKMGQAYGANVSQREERRGRFYGDTATPEGVVDAKKNRMRFVRDLLGLEPRR